jgi:hypothetical protein
MRRQTSRAIDRQQEIDYYLHLARQFPRQAEAFRRTAKRIEKEKIAESVLNEAKRRKRTRD